MNKKLSISLVAILLLILLPSSNVKAEEYNAYVDADNTTGTEDGTAEHPYNTITEAIDSIVNNASDQKKIHVSAGTYVEQVTLSSDVKLYGENKDTVIINGDVNDFTVKMGHNTFLQEVTVSDGRTGILIEENSKADIDNVKVKDTEKIGIEKLASSGKNTDKMTVENSEIYDNDAKGFYIQKGKIDISDNSVHDNGEEGIDIRAKVKGKIKSNDIYENGESGIETLVNGSKLKITKNKLKHNHSSGISTQYYSESPKSGKLTLESNTMKSNSKYGVDCGTPSGGSTGSGYWRKNIDLISNVMRSNKLGKYDKRCKF